MNKNQYLIPANTKKGELLFGIFKKGSIDIWLFLGGVLITLLGLLLLSGTEGVDNVTAILIVLPAGIATVLVFPFPNYYNIRTAIGEVIRFYTNRQKYVWRGWCSKYEFKDK